MFDEQPDGDIHGECAAEIHCLQAELKILQAATTDLLKVAPKPRLLLDDYGIAVERALQAVIRVEMIDMHQQTAQAIGFKPVYFHQIGEINENNKWEEVSEDEMKRYGLAFQRVLFEQK